MSLNSTTSIFVIAILFTCHVSAVSVNRIWCLFVCLCCVSLRLIPHSLIVPLSPIRPSNLQQDLLQGQKVYYKDPRTRIENRRYEKPMHMQRKANLHQQKALLEHDTIEKNLKSIKLNATTTLTRNGRTTNNFVCNDDTQMSDAGYKCKNMDQISFVSNAELGSNGSSKCGFDYIKGMDFPSYTEAVCTCWYVGWHKFC